jgi:hypothetical protein
MLMMSEVSLFTVLFLAWFNGVIFRFFFLGFVCGVGLGKSLYPRMVMCEIWVFFNLELRGGFHFLVDWELGIGIDVSRERIQGS